MPVDERGNTLAHVAAESDEAECILALAACPAWSADARNARGMSALHVASQANAPRSVRALIDAGAALDAINEWRETPLHLAAAAGHAQVVDVLLAASDLRGYAWGEALDRWGRSATHVAREQGEASAVAPLGGASAAHEAPPREPRSAPASTRGQPGDAGNAEQREQLRRELIAALERRVAVKVPLPLATTPSTREPPLASTEPRVACAPAPHARAPSGARALSKLVEYPGDAAAISALLAQPDVHAGGRDMFGLTALHKFAAWNRVQLVELLLSAMSREDANARGGEHGWTALHFAADAGACEAYAALFRAPALVDTGMRDLSGRTAAELLARLHGQGGVQQASEDASAATSPESIARVRQD